MAKMPTEVVFTASVDQAEGVEEWIVSVRAATAEVEAAMRNLKAVLDEPPNLAIVVHYGPPEPPVVPPPDRNRPETLITDMTDEDGWCGQR